jgi:peptidoglycan hydrolase-like protein with peptidoglycan-binding domain
MALLWVVWRDNKRIQQAEQNSPSMKSGEKGEAVHLLQAALILNGIDVPHHGVTKGVRNDNYLQETQTAVRAAEKKFGLTIQDQGIAGKQVIGALDRECNKFYTAHAGHFGRDLAVSDAPRALRKVGSALSGLRTLRAHMTALPSNPSPLTVVNEALRVHFRLLAPGVARRPVARIATLGDIQRIIDTYQRMQFVLRGATFTFQDGIPFNGVKTAAESNTGSERVTFGPNFADFDGPIDKRIGNESRVAVVLHESMHSVDISGTSGDDEIHISEFDPAYDLQPANLSMFNPSSYASFAAHVFRGQDPQPRFGLGPGSRGLDAK